MNMKINSQEFWEEIENIKKSIFENWFILLIILIIFWVWFWVWKLVKAKTTKYDILNNEINILAISNNKIKLDMLKLAKTQVLQENLYNCLTLNRELYEKWEKFSFCEAEKNLLNNFIKWKN